MTPLAHAGHWAAQLLYLAPVLAMVGAILVGRIASARRGGADGRRARGLRAPPEAPLVRANVPYRTSSVCRIGRMTTPAVHAAA